MLCSVVFCCACLFVRFFVCFCFVYLGEGGIFCLFLLILGVRSTRFGMERIKTFSSIFPGFSSTFCLFVLTLGVRSTRFGIENNAILFFFPESTNKAVN